MSQTICLSLPGITCVSCVSAIDTALSQCKSLHISSWSTDIIDKETFITIEDEIPKTDAIAILSDIIEEVGFESRPKRHYHILKGILGTLAGVLLVGLSLSGFLLPFAASGIIAGVSTLLTLYLGKEAFLHAGKNLFKARTLTMDSLFAISTLTVIGVSIASLFVPWLPMMFDAALFIFGFRHFGMAIEKSMKKKVTSGLAFKSRATPVVSRKKSEDEWEDCEIASLQPDDVIRLKQGDTLPVDGVLQTPQTSVYRTILTGSTEPAILRKGERLLAGMRVPLETEGLEMRVTKTVDDSNLARMEKMVIEAKRTKAPIEETTDRILQRYFIPGILLLAIITAIVVGVVFSPVHAIQCATTLLVSACPCTLGFITPMANRIGMSKSAELGITFKSAKALQDASRIDTVAFDLNGPLTTNVFQVISHHHTCDEETFFSVLSALEEKSSHAIGKTLYSLARKQVPEPRKVTVLNPMISNGIKATVDGQPCLLGNEDFLEKNGITPPPVAEGETSADRILWLVINGEILGHVRLRDTLRQDAKRVVDILKQMKHIKKLCIITGESEKIAKCVAREIGIPEGNVYAKCVSTAESPTERTKTDCIRALQAEGHRVAMIGDAGNDAPAVAGANFGIAIQSESADPDTQNEAGAVIDRASLLPVVTAFSVARQTLKSIHQNLAISLVYNIGMAVLASCSMVIFGACFPPAIGVALMVVQMLLILGNQYRIRHQVPAHLKSLSEEPDGQDRSRNHSWGLFARRGICASHWPAPNSPAALSHSLCPATLSNSLRPAALSNSAGRSEESETPGVRGCR